MAHPPPSSPSLRGDADSPQRQLDQEMSDQPYFNLSNNYQNPTTAGSSQNNTQISLGDEIPNTPKGPSAFEESQMNIPSSPIRRGQPEIINLSSQQTGRGGQPRQPGFQSSTPSIREVFDYSANTDRPLLFQKRKSNNDQLGLSKKPTLEKSPRSAREYLLEARTLIYRAAAGSEGETQNQISNLLEHFTSLLERGVVANAANVLAQQIGTLESVVRRMDHQATRQTQQSKTTAPPAQAQKETTQHQATKPFLQSQLFNPSEKTMDIRSKKSQTKPLAAKIAKITKIKEHRVILTKSNIRDFNDIDPYTVVKQINDAFTAKGYQGPVISHIQRTQTNNLALISTPSWPASKILESQDIWRHILPYENAHIDHFQYKVIVNGVSTKVYNTPDPQEGLEAIKAQLKVFQPNLNITHTPQWLTPTESRRIKLKGSIILTFGTMAEQKQACRGRFIIGGESLTGVEYIQTAKTTQCQRCCGFGHLESFCRHDPRCKLCGENHHTRAHNCNVCKTTGSACTHMIAKCVNCKETHTADSKTCPFFVSIKNSQQNAMETEL